MVKEFWPVIVHHHHHDVEERKFTGGNKIPVDYLENKRREREREGNENKGET